MWKNIDINLNQIKYDTGSAVLISMPHSGEYDGFMFWHPTKLIRDGKHRAAVSIGYTDEFVFHLKKYGQGRHNSREVIEEKDISAGEFEDAFDNTSSNISSRRVNPYETHKPEHLEAEETEAINELRDE